LDDFEIILRQFFIASTAQSGLFLPRVVTQGKDFKLGPGAYKVFIEGFVVETSKNIR
jgi:hypothetical protein